MTDALSQEASNASVQMAVRADFEAGLSVEGDQFQTIRDVLDSLGMVRLWWMASRWGGRGSGGDGEMRRKGGLK